jgi:hypothetical protein
MYCGSIPRAVRIVVFATTSGAHPPPA